VETVTSNVIGTTNILEALRSQDKSCIAVMITSDKAYDNVEWEWGYVGGWPHSYGPERTGKRLAEFQEKWEAIIREWSVRWGGKVHGWWIDGCWFADEMYRHAEPPNFRSFAAALKAGNPDSLVAFNPGVSIPVVRHTEYEDYTAGEISTALPECPGPEVNGAQWHILTYLGTDWGKGEPRFPTDMVVGYTKHVRERGGVITWDVRPTEEGGIAESFLKQLEGISRNAGADASSTDGMVA